MERKQRVARIAGVGVIIIVAVAGAVGVLLALQQGNSTPATLSPNITSNQAIGSGEAVSEMSVSNIGESEAALDADGDRVGGMGASTLDRLLKEIQQLGEPERRYASGPLSTRGPMVTLAQAVDLVQRTGIDTLTYSTVLNENGLIARFGPPDRVSERAVNGVTCRGLQYEWLIVYVTEMGEVFAVGREPTE